MSLFCGQRNRLRLFCGSLLALCAGTIECRATLPGAETVSEQNFYFASGAELTVYEGNTGLDTNVVTVSVCGKAPGSVNVYVLPGSATAIDYATAQKCVPLVWDDDDDELKTVSIPLVNDTVAEGNECFFLVLGASTPSSINEPRVCKVTIVDNDSGIVPNRGVYVAGLSLEPEGGTVSGGQYCLQGGAVKLVASALPGWTFLSWEDGSMSTVRMVSGDEAFSGSTDNVKVCLASFKRTDALELPVSLDPGAQSAIAGVAYSMPLPVISETLPKVVVKGLPPGLRYDPNALRIVGIPGVPGEFTVSFQASNPKGVAPSQSFLLSVSPLPSWAVGRFDGLVETEALGKGRAEMSVTTKGRITGKVTLCGTNFVFVAKAFTSFENFEDGSVLLWIDAVAKAGKVSMPMLLAMGVSVSMDASGIVPDTLSVAEGPFSDDGWLSLNRNVWRDPGMTDALSNHVGYYTAVIPGGAEYGSGYLMITVGQTGGVKTTGKLADGTALSLSGDMILDRYGCTYTVLQAEPKGYKGGGVFGVIEFVRDGTRNVPFVRMLYGVPLVWRNLSPKATPVYGEGFSREVGVDGGWYDTLGNLYRYYEGKQLSVATDLAAPMPDNVVSNGSAGTAWWTPHGLVMAVLTNEAGVMTGLMAPRNGTAIGGASPYENATPTNAVDFSIGVTRQTGLFKGLFKTRTDNGSMQQIRPIRFEGVLVPERADPDDKVGGRGFFLWKDVATVSQAPGRTYQVSWSYDLKLMLSFGNWDALSVDQSQRAFISQADWSNGTAQSFRAGSTSTLIGIKLVVQRRQGPCDLTLELRRAGANDVPVGAVLATGTLPGDVFVDRAVKWYTIIFDKPYSQQAGEKLSFSVKATESSAKHGYLVYWFSMNNPYGNGCLYYKGYGPNSWTYDKRYIDLAFETLVIR